MIAKAVARNIAEMIHGVSSEPRYPASMAEMGAACVASAGANPFTGTAASITVYPIVPDFERYPEYGRDISKRFGKILFHHMFLYKARLRPGWSLIPE